MCVREWTIFSMHTYNAKALFFDSFAPSLHIHRAATQKINTCPSITIIVTSWRTNITIRGLPASQAQPSAVFNTPFQQPSNVFPKWLSLSANWSKHKNHMGIYERRPCNAFEPKE